MIRQTPGRGVANMRLTCVLAGLAIGVPLHASFVSTVTATAGCYSTGALFASCSGSYGSASGSVFTDGINLVFSMDAQGPPTYQSPFGASVDIDVDYDYSYSVRGRTGNATVVVAFDRQFGDESIACLGIPFRAGCTVLVDLTPPIPITFGVPFRVRYYVHATAWADGGVAAASIHNQRISIKGFDIYLEPPGTPGVRQLPIGSIPGDDSGFIRLFGTDADLQADAPAPEPTTGLLMMTTIAYIARKRLSS